MPQLTATSLTLALVLLGCSSQAQPNQVELLTGGPFAETGGCSTNSEVGLLTVDPRFGTAIEIERPPDQQTGPIPVMWGPGFTGVRVGSEVAVRDPAGNTVATTGRRYAIEGGMWYRDEFPEPFVACGSVSEVR